jgi:large subunit ribosomal protein L25
MKTVSLSGALRAHVGKKDAKTQRYEGKVPCVIYGGKDQVHFSTDATSFKPIIFTPETFVIDINIDGKNYLTILKDIQYHPVSDEVLHADFYEVSPEKPIVVSIPVKLTGTSPGVIRGGKLTQKLNKLKIKGLIKDLPDYLNVSISNLDVGQSIKIKDLAFDNLRFLDLSTAVIAEVKTARGVVAGE